MARSYFHWHLVMCVYETCGRVLCFIDIENILEAHTPDSSYDYLYRWVRKDDSKYKLSEHFHFKISINLNVFVLQIYITIIDIINEIEKTVSFLKKYRSSYIYNSKIPS